MNDFKFWGLLSLMVLSISSCTKEKNLEIKENNTSTSVEAEIFTIKASMANLEQTRATVNPDDGYSFKWQRDDSFVIYQSADITKANIFTIDNESISEDGKSADFTSKDFSVTDDAKYYAFYPQGVTESENIFTYTIPETVYIQSGNNNTEHLKSGLIMFANGKSSEVQNGISFTHKTALFRFGIKNYYSEAVTIKSLKLSSTDLECFAKQYSYNINGNETIGTKSTSLSLGFGEEGLSINPEGVMKAYTLAVPADKISENETFTLEVTFADNTTKSITIDLNSDDSFVAGKYYTFNINLRKTPEITSVEIGDLLHNETTALVESGKELVIKGEGFGSVKEDISLTIGETKAEITSINDTEIKFTVPTGFTEGKISIEFAGVNTPVEYGTIFKLLTVNTDVTEYVLRNYKAPFTPLDGTMLRDYEWMKPLDWIVDNKATDNMAGYALQLSTKGDKTTGNALVLQTDWGFPTRMYNGKIYQNTYLVTGRYKLSVIVPIAVLSGKAYLAICTGENFPTTLDESNNNISSSFADVEIPYNKLQQTVNLEFTINTSGKYSIGLIANLTYTQRYVKVQEFQLEYLGAD